MERRASRRLRIAVAVLAVLSWIGLAAIGIGWAVVIETLDSGYCEHEQGDSNDGEQSWSVMPPGCIDSFFLEPDVVRRSHVPRYL
jgi:hypothetical protein